MPKPGSHVSVWRGVRQRRSRGFDFSTAFDNNRKYFFKFLWKKQKVEGWMYKVYSNHLPFVFVPINSLLFFLLCFFAHLIRRLKWASLVVVVVLNFSHFYLFSKLKSLDQFQTNLVQSIIGWREFKFVQMNGHVLFKEEIILNYMLNLLIFFQNLLKIHVARKSIICFESSSGSVGSRFLRSFWEELPQGWGQMYT